jgi:aerobic carbon-monoxide dehydrogenase small subunit
MTKQTIELDVNGRRCSMHVEPRKTLADALREDCGMTSVHLGCEHGVCGACTIILDGEPARACLMYAVQAQGSAIRTTESMAQGQNLHPMQEAFTQSHAVQCGFCTPGFLMLTVAALEREPDLDEDALRDVVASNLCRCTGYENILAAVRDGAAAMKARS